MGQQKQVAKPISARHSTPTCTHHHTHTQHKTHTARGRKWASRRTWPSLQPPHDTHPHSSPYVNLVERRPANRMNEEITTARANNSSYADTVCCIPPRGGGLADASGPPRNSYYNHSTPPTTHQMLHTGMDIQYVALLCVDPAQSSETVKVWGAPLAQPTKGKEG